MKVSRKQILQYWDYWLLWRMLGKRIEAFVVALDWKGPLPKIMLEVFFELDAFYEKMEAQALEKELESKRNNGR